MPHRQFSSLLQVIVLMICSLGMAAPLSAQDSIVRNSEVPVGRPIASSIGLGAVGFLGGGLFGAVAGSGCSGEDCEIESAVLWGIVGITVGTALGAHLGNRRAGSFPLDVIASGGAALVGIGLTNLLSEDNGGPILLMVPIAQIAAAVGTERATGRRRLRGVEVAIVPVQSEIGLFIRITR